MNEVWRKIFSNRLKTQVVRRKRVFEDGWLSGRCDRDFSRKCNAALHLKQSTCCLKKFGMIYPAKLIIELESVEESVSMKPSLYHKPAVLKGTFLHEEEYNYLDIIPCSPTFLCLNLNT